MSFFKQPILHFLLLGGLFFAFYAWVNDDEAAPDNSQIIVDEDRLLEYFQYRNRAFNPVEARRQLAALPPDEFAAMKSRLVREEALYREGLKLQMDRNDYIIKQRMIQKMEYLARGFNDEDDALPEDAVVAYYENHRERYFDPPTITFTHVFLAGEDPAAEKARGRAESLLATLNSEEIGFSGAMGYGERFIYHTNYVDRSIDFVGSHFGDSFASDVIKLAPDDRHWYGPLASKHGLHLVMVAKSDAGGIPPLDEIYDRVERDARQAALDTRTEKAIQQIVAGYDVVDRVTVEDLKDDRVAHGN